MQNLVGNKMQVEGISRGNEVVKGRVRLRRMNECFVKTDHLPRAEALFDAFWREGELALLFGPAGIGKSVLAMQVAEAVARGRGIGRFAMPMYRRRVLYVDLVMSDAEIQRRYSYRAGVMGELKTYKFSGSLYHDRPEDISKLGDWLREAVREDGIRVVVVDDLSAVRQTADGTRETLRLMRELKKVKEELGISILVLADSMEPRRGSTGSEADLGRSRVLCDVADSVFAMGRAGRNASDRRLVQLRSRNAEPVWNAYNGPIGRMGRLDDGFLGFTFDERFAERMAQETLDLICKIKAMYDGGKKFRAIAEELGMAQSQTWRLYQKWRPEMGRVEEKEEFDTDEHGKKQNCTDRDSKEIDEQDEWDEAGFEKPEWVESNGEMRTENGRCLSAEGELEGDDKAVDFRQGQTDEEKGIDLDRSVVNAQSLTLNYSAMPFAAGLRRRSIYDLKRTLNAYDKEIFVESELPDGKPLIWYHVDNKGYVNRWVRRGGGPEGRRLGPAPYIEIGGWQPDAGGWRIYVPDRRHR
ncbi:MAG TPA: AAA family ATPase [Pyrinomonadaceae bacterium]|nr:AAA family ATPase [Pyrinomonadaceae bacterium]